MIFIGIDISVNSSAMTVGYKGEVFFYNYTSKSSSYKWIKNTSDIINYRFINFDYISEDNFSDRLLKRLQDYDGYTDRIIEDIKYFYEKDNLTIGIEGYNYGLKTTDSIIDISELSSILKLKLLNEFEFSNIVLIPPKSVKIKTCEMVYGKPQGKKLSRNTDGIAGGSFDKHDMLKSFIDMNNTNDLKGYLSNEIETIFNMKNIPKPFDDIIDSYFIMKIVESGFSNI
jgi:hypothetical protein